MNPPIYIRKENLTPEQQVAEIGNSTAWHPRADAPGFMQITMDKLPDDERTALLQTFLERPLANKIYAATDNFDTNSPKKFQTVTLEQKPDEESVTLTVPYELYNRIRHYYAPEAEKSKYPIVEEKPKYPHPIRSAKRLSGFSEVHDTLVPPEVLAVLSETGMQFKPDYTMANGGLVGNPSQTPIEQKTSQTPYKK